MFVWPNRGASLAAQAGSASPARLLGRWLTLVVSAFLLVACSTPGRVVDHAFSFDVRRAEPPVEILDYRYGTSGLPGARPAEYQVKEGKVGSATLVRGAMTVGDYLYVKWRLKETGEVFEDTVDLRDRLPRDIKDHQVCFYIVGRQLYVYVVDPGFLSVGAPEEIAVGAPIRNLPFTYHSKYQIVYPNQESR